MSKGAFSTPVYVFAHQPSLRHQSCTIIHHPIALPVLPAIAAILPYTLTRPGWLNLLGQIASVSAVAFLCSGLITTLAAMTSTIDGSEHIKFTPAQVGWWMGGWDGTQQHNHHVDFLCKTWILGAALYCSNTSRSAPRVSAQAICHALSWSCVSRLTQGLCPNQKP